MGKMRTVKIFAERTSGHGGQSPSQQRRLQAWRPQSRARWHSLTNQILIARNLF